MSEHNHHPEHGNYWQAQCLETKKIEKTRHLEIYSFHHVLRTHCSYYPLTLEFTMPLRVYLGVNILLASSVQPSVRRWNDSCHSKGSYFYLAFCLQQPLSFFLANILLTSSSLCHTVDNSCHSTGTFFFLALSSQQPLSFSFFFGGTFYLHH